VAALVRPAAARRRCWHHTGLDRDYSGVVSLPDHGKSGRCSRSRACRRAPWSRTCARRALEATDADLDGLAPRSGSPPIASIFPAAVVGQARRVALARAFASPDLLVPGRAVSLDDALAEHLRDELAALVTSRRVTTLLVTHNIDEAIGLADRLFLLSSSPTRVVAEVPIARPRGSHSANERAEIRAEIARRLDEAVG
jgi:NitT/TauT family transport system ATP-binding protein